MRHAADEATPRILVDKSARRLHLLGVPIERTFEIALGRNALSDKEIEGDHATPVGEFYVCAKNPRSRYFLSLCLSYPTAGHAQRGLAAGRLDAGEYACILDALAAGTMPPQHTRLGGEIYIHGYAPDGRVPAARDWTRGCIAVENVAMREIYDAAAVGTPVRIIA